MDSVQLTGGVLTNYGLTEFKPDHEISEVSQQDLTMYTKKSKGNFPYQCLPIYLNDDDALDIVKRKAVSADLSGSLYIPNDVSETGIVWVIFRGFIQDLLQSGMGYTEWRDFVVDNDHLLPINFQVGNHHDANYNEYLMGSTNKYAVFLATGFSNVFHGDVKTTISGSKFLQFVFDAETDYNAKNSVVAGTPTDQPLQKTNPYQRVVTNYVEHGSRIVDTKTDVEEHFDITNTINIFTYNGRLEAWFFPDKPWSTYLNRIGAVISPLFFADDDVDQYVDDLNTYLNDDDDYDEDFSQYVDNQKTLMNLNHLKNQPVPNQAHGLKGFLNLLRPIYPLNYYQLNRLLVFLTMVMWMGSIFVNVRLAYFLVTISEHVWEIVMIPLLMPTFAAGIHYLWSFTRFDAQNSLLVGRLQIKAQVLQYQGAIGLWYVFWTALTWGLVYSSHFVVTGGIWLPLLAIIINWGLFIWPVTMMHRLPNSRSYTKRYTAIELGIGALLAAIMM